jgi:signal peptidase II
MTTDARANLRSPAAWARFLLTCAIGLALDLVTKIWAFNHLVIGPIEREGDGRLYVPTDIVRFIPGWLHFEAVANEGAVFGLGQGHRLLFLAVSFGAIGLLTYLFINSGRARFYQVVLGMLLAGVLGNMYDRMAFGYVRDMIHALPGRRWPEFIRETLSFIPYVRGPIFPWIFNIADSLLCVGVAVSIFYSLRHQTPAGEDKDDRPRSREDAKEMQG